MGTTDPALATALLDGLHASGSPYAFLHHEREAAAGVITSDVDIVVGQPFHETLATLRKVAGESDAGLVLVWPYDANSLSTFWMTRDLRGGVQIDLLRDPAGKGKYGLRTDVALQHCQPGQRWMTLSPPVQRLYQLSKKWDKQDTAKLHELVRDPVDGIDSDLKRRLLSPAARRSVESALAGRAPSSRRALYYRVRARISGRYFERVRHPIGVLIRIGGDRAPAGVLADHVRSLMSPVVVKCQITDGRSRIDTVRRFFALRRPWILLSLEDVGTCPHLEVYAADSVDLDLASGDVWDRLVSLMDDRTKELLRDVHKQ